MLTCLSEVLTCLSEVLTCSSQVATCLSKVVTEQSFCKHRSSPCYRVANSTPTILVQHHIALITAETLCVSIKATFCERGMLQRDVDPRGCFELRSYAKSIRRVLYDIRIEWKVTAGYNNLFVCQIGSVIARVDIPGYPRISITNHGYPWNAKAVNLLPS